MTNIKRLLILNNYNNYHLYKFKYYCKENNIVIFYISFYLFYLFQLFDIGCFNILKQSYGREVENLIQFYINYIIKLDFFVCFYITFFTIFNEENIRIGFRSIGFVPFNPDAVIFKLDIKLYISIPTGPLSTEVDFWIVKILQNL